MVKDIFLSKTDVKSGQCPTFDADYMLAAGCLVECKKDEDCDDKLKCCSTGCGAVCAKPTAQKQAPILGKMIRRSGFVSL